MKVSVNDPLFVPSLLRFLQRRVHLTAEQIGPVEVEVSQLGSMNAHARRLELDVLLRLWRSSQAGARAAILD
jgi:hypothetical protein